VFPKGGERIRHECARKNPASPFDVSFAPFCEILAVMSDVFSENRSLLFGIAYRMLGRVADAEDVVQDAFLRWQQQDRSRIRQPVAWLTTTVTRLCIDHLRLARTQREEYYGVWLPEPLVTDGPASPDAAGALADSLGMAFLLLLEELPPLDRAVFLLREAFEFDYADIARTVDKSEAACRQIVSRAKARLGRREVSAMHSGSEAAEKAVRQFLAACESGRMDDLLATLTEDAVFYGDGGGIVRSAPRPIRSAPYVSRFFVGIGKKLARAFPGTRARHRFVRVNGEPGVLTRRVDGVFTVMTFAFENGRIKAIYIVSNPEKLAGVPAALIAELSEGGSKD
jgi:RNA polymerase sigma-70 factor (ECF subfamily)